MGPNNKHEVEASLKAQTCKLKIFETLDMMNTYVDCVWSIKRQVAIDN